MIHSKVKVMAAASPVRLSLCAETEFSERWIMTQPRPECDLYPRSWSRRSNLFGLSIVNPCRCRPTDDEWVSLLAEPRDVAFEGALLRAETAETLGALVAAIGVSQRALASRLHLSEPRVHRILKDDVNLTLNTVASIAFALGCRVNLVLVPVEDRDGTAAEDDPPATDWLLGMAELSVQRVANAISTQRRAARATDSVP